MTVITISRQFGSGGDEIAESVCQMMNYRRFDKLMIAKAAVESGLSDEEIVDFSEENYKVKNFFDRLFRRTETGTKARYWRENLDGLRVVEEISLSEDHLLMLVQKAVLSAYQSGNMVIVGRGGQMILHDFADVLHLRFEAPLEDRLQNVRAQIRKEHTESLRSVDLRREAQDMILERDNASADYLKRFYAVDWANPMLYHVILNTGRITVPQASEYIVGMLRSSFYAKPEALTGTLS
jgi:cytidylate kinase